jgi:hypothetical protein
MALKRGEAVEGNRHTNANLLGLRFGNKTTGEGGEAIGEEDEDDDYFSGYNISHEGSTGSLSSLADPFPSPGSTSRQSGSEVLSPPLAIPLYDAEQIRSR